MTTSSEPETILVMPRERLDDMAHDWEPIKGELVATFVEAFGSVDSDCYLCQSGCCVRRHFAFSNGSHMILHGAYEA